MSPISERFAAASGRLTTLIDAIPADAWENPSPCANWTARDVLDHVVTTEVDFLGQRGLPAPDIAGLDPWRAWPTVRDSVISVLNDTATATTSFDGYFGPTTIEATLDRFYCLDLLVHRWDLATATGLLDHAALDDHELRIIRASIESFPPEVMRMPGLFEPAIEPDPGADATTTLMNFLGRAA
jgi:uncharacterized protein (TIGR03086 family)